MQGQFCVAWCTVICFKLLVVVDSSSMYIAWKSRNTMNLGLQLVASLIDGSTRKIE